MQTKKELVGKLKTACLQMQEASLTVEMRAVAESLGELMEDIWNDLDVLFQRADNLSGNLADLTERVRKLEKYQKLNG